MDTVLIDGRVLETTRLAFTLVPSSMPSEGVTTHLTVSPFTKPEDRVFVPPALLPLIFQL